jgi:hypothetical protein
LLAPREQGHHIRNRYYFTAVAFLGERFRFSLETWPRSAPPTEQSKLKVADYPDKNLMKIETVTSILGCEEVIRQQLISASFQKNLL